MIVNHDIATFWTEPNTAPIIAPDTIDSISGVQLGETLELRKKNSGSFTITTTVVIF